MVDMPTLRDLHDRFRPPSALSSMERRDMAKIAVIGEGVKVLGFGLPGAIVLPAEGPEAVLAAWLSLGEDVAVVVLTSRAARTLAGRTASWPLTAVMPP
jgi:vacuolar-type H+-ATPase subunit F/Vma7